MEKKFIEKGFVVFMFVMVLVIFSFAQHDSRKLIEIYSAGSTASFSGLDNSIAASFSKPEPARMYP